MKYISILLFAILLSFPALAGEKSADCERCDYFHHGAKTGLKSVVPDEICVVAPYDKSGDAQLTLTREDGSIRRIIKRYFDLTKTKIVRICLGPQWFNDETVGVDLCNTENHSDMIPGSLPQVRARHELDMCLLGKEGCAAYKAKHLYPFN